jgi:acetyl esterase/lipase
MKVTKDMLDAGLQSIYSPLKIVSFLLTRKWGINLANFQGRFSKGKNIERLDCEERFIPSKSGGPDIRIRIFKPLNHKGKLPAMLYYHSGGLVIGTPEMSLDIIKQFINKRPCVVIAPDYRKAMKAPFPAGFNDCYDTLLWAKENTDDLEIVPNKFIVAGHSAGGGLAAAVTLKARDTQDVDVAFQMPIYPMIDDRQITESAKNIEVNVWNTKTNAFAWDFYLKDLKENKKEIPVYAAPARNTDYKNFPPTITFVGELEPFRDETIAYVEALKKEGIPVIFKFYKGCFHGFDAFGAKSRIAEDAINYTYESYAKYYDAYVA